LRAVLDQLNPAGGIVDHGDGSGKHAKNGANKQKKQNKKNATPPSQDSQNANDDDE